MQEWAFCTNWSHGTKSALDSKKAWHPPLGHRKQRKVKLDRLEFLCVRINYILLPSRARFFECRLRDKTPFRRIFIEKYSRLPITRTFNVNSKSFVLSGVRVIEGKIKKKMTGRETKIGSS